MKNITMLVTSWCPHCKTALSLMEELKNENPKFKEAQVRVVDEELEPEIAKQYDYYYVPTYYVGEEKIHEGVPSKDIIRNVYEKSLD